VRRQTWFQSTRPCGARRAMTGVSTNCLKFQSTRPCGARHHYGESKCKLFVVSIHAPVRGATYSASIICIIYPCFNPRARAGRDLLRDYASPQQDTVSIHAPVRGATERILGLTTIAKGFNPRARAGRDRGEPGGLRLPASFNPRARAGRDC